MTLVHLLDIIGLASAVFAMYRIMRFRSPEIGADVRASLLGLFALALFTYSAYSIYEWGGSPVFEALSDIARIVGPLAFFFVFYTFIQSRANRELQASEERYRALFEGATDGLLISNLEGTEWEANPALCAMHGYSREEFHKSMPWTYIEPEDFGQFQAFQKALAEGKSYVGKARGLRKDGTSYWGEVDARLLHFGGQPHVVSTIRDVTQHDEIQEARERLVAVLDATTDLVGTSEPGGRSVYMNLAGRRLLGLGDDEDITGNPADQNHTPESFDLIRNVGMPEAIKNGIWRGETRLLSRDGTVTDVSQVIIAHRGADNRITHLSTIARDISESKRAAEALRASERRLFRFMENLPVGIVITTREGETYLLNRAGREMFGLASGAQTPLAEQSQLLGLYRAGTDELYPPDDFPAIRALKGERVHVEDFEIRQNGRIVPLEVWASPVRDDRNEITHSITGLLDISDRKRAEEQRRLLEGQLLQSQKMESIGMLAGGVAHDFNNLLVAIVGYSELILSAADENTPFVEEIREIRSAGDRAAGLTRQLLAFSRKQVLQPAALDLNRIVRDVELLLKRVIGEHIDLLSFLEPEGAPIEADRVQFEQVLVNLAVNARDAMPKGGRLVFETRSVQMDGDEARVKGFKEGGPFIVLSVSDNGVGMDDAVRRKIFEPFFSTKDREKGTGLGLSTVYGIVKQSGGEIEVMSTPGEGSCFKLYFPREHRMPLIESTSHGSSSAESAGQETVLLVEDEAAPRRLSARVLKEAGYTVLEAVSAEAALELSRKYNGQIDLLLSDVVLPGLGGGELAEQLVKERPTARVLFTSGYVDNPIVQEAVRRGGAFLAKPFTPRELTEAIRRALENV